MTEVSIEQLAVLFREASSAHKRAFEAVDGKDPEWPAWYAEFLAPRLENVLGQRFEVPQLAQDLRLFDAEHLAAGAGEPWTDFYARRLLDRMKA